MRFEAPPNSMRDILIVDDEEDNRFLLEAILRKEGYGYRVENNGRDAVEAAKKKAPDLVIMDVCMPYLDGFDACRQIKEHWNDYLIPVILLTGLGDTDNKVKGLDAGADEYLVKPPGREELLARVRAMLRIRDLHHNLLASKKELELTNEELLKARGIIEKELEDVGNIQRSFLPDHLPYHPEIEFGRYYEPCEKAGGDYYDLIEIGKQHWGLLMADVTGHGTPAAVVMAITHTLMHSFIRSFHFPSTALKVANEKLNEHLAPTIFITMFYGVLNLDQMVFRYASAGHEPMMLYRARERKVEYLKTHHGFPLKLMANDNYDEDEIEIEPSDKLILFTDGLVEHRNPQGELFSTERFESLVLKYHHLPAQEFVNALVEEIRNFHPEEPFMDDVTIFVLERKCKRP